MTATKPGNADRSLLVFNCHESWVYQLNALGYPLDIIVGLPGRYTANWDEKIRPVPARGRLVTLREVLKSNRRYHCIIAHNVTDLMDVKDRADPKLLVIHSTMEGRLTAEKTHVDPGEMKRMLSRYIALIQGHVVSVSRLKGDSMGFSEDIVPFGADPDDYPKYSGQKPCGLRISNFFKERGEILLQGLHRSAFDGLPIRMVGHNPGLPGVTPSENWAHLKRLFQTHRFYIHTADPKLEDGYNMATTEAMAAGMPVLGNRHPTSPIQHGVSGFLSDDPEKLRSYAKRLLADRQLAVEMGREARRVIRERFSLDRFRERFVASIETARAKCGPDITLKAQIPNPNHK